MKTSTTCPSCDRKIGFGRVLRAPTPFHLSCADCGARLRVRGAAVPVTLAIATVVGLGLAALIRAYGLRPMLVTVIGVALVAELIACLVVVNSPVERRS